MVTGIKPPFVTFLLPQFLIYILHLISKDVFMAVMSSTRVLAQSTCTSALISMSPCLNYITGNTTSPSQQCCSQLGNVVRSSPDCLCQVLNGGGSQLGINVNQTQALALPRACNVQTPPVSRGRRRRRGRTIVRRKLYQVLISSSCLPFRGFLHGNLLEILSFPIHSSPETYEAFIPLRLHSLFFPTCSHFLVTSCDVFILCSVSPYSPGDIGSLYRYISLE